MNLSERDAACLTAVNSNPNMVVPWMLMGSYLYYHKDETLVNDTVYDWMTKVLRDHWDSLTHRHRHILVPIIQASTGSLFDIHPEDYPTITRFSAAQLMGSSA